MRDALRFVAGSRLRGREDCWLNNQVGFETMWSLFGDAVPSYEPGCSGSLRGEEIPMKLGNFNSHSISQQRTIPRQPLISMTAEGLKPRLSEYIVICWGDRTLGLFHLLVGLDCRVVDSVLFINSTESKPDRRVRFGYVC